MKVFIFSTLFMLYCTSLFCQSKWQWLNPLPSGYANDKIKFVDSNTGFILNNNGDLIKTIDRGNSWKVVNNFPNTFYMDFKDSTGIIAGYSESVQLSFDNGKTWQNTNTGAIDNVKGVCVESRDTIFVIGGGPNIYESVDRGKTWSTQIGQTASSFSFVDSKMWIIGTASGSIYKTIDGGNTWKNTSQVNYYPASIEAIQFINKDTGYAFGHMNDILITNDGGNTWTSIDPKMGLSTVYSMYFANSSVGYVGGDNGFMYKTIDAGITWNACANPKADAAGSGISPGK